jgi:cytochrome c5
VGNEKGKEVEDKTTKTAPTFTGSNVYIKCCGICHLAKKYKVMQKLLGIHGFH